MILITLITSVCAFRFQTQLFYDFINSQQSTWKAGHNSRWDSFTEQTLKTQMGTLLDEPDFLKLPMQPEVDVLELPENFDAREQWPNCQSLKEVRDQSTCGSCWAFGAAEAMSDRLCIATGKQTRISTEDLLTCCGLTCGMGCNGGWPSGAWGYFKSKGLVTGNAYGDNSWCRPYSFPPCDHHTDETKYGPCGESKPTPSCVKTCSQQSGRDYNSDKIHSIDSYSVSSKVEQIQNEIYTYGPVEASFTVYEDFLSYKSGVYQHVTGASLGGHAVKIIGWGVENNVPYWLVVNSWNEGWGENGLFKILRGSNHVGIEGGIYAGRVI